MYYSFLMFSLNPQTGRVFTVMLTKHMMNLGKYYILTGRYVKAQT